MLHSANQAIRAALVDAEGRGVAVPGTERFALLPDAPTLQQIEMRDTGVSSRGCSALTGTRSCRSASRIPASGGHRLPPRNERGAVYPPEQERVPVLPRRFRPRPRVQQPVSARPRRHHASPPLSRLESSRPAFHRADKASDLQSSPAVGAAAVFRRSARASAFLLIR